MNENKSYILWFNEIGMEDVPRVGGKNASLGEMYRELSPEGIKVPNGFAATSAAYWHFVNSAGILEDLKEILAGLDKSNVKDLVERSLNAQQLILNARLPDDLWEAIKASYDKLCEQYGPETDVAVRSSATAEDLPTTSFAGQMESYLNVRGYDQLQEACLKCYASLFTDRAISYRIDNHFDHFKVALSIGIMKMVRSDKACSGVIFTLDTETGFRNVVLVTGSYGLGENIVKGAVNPDEFYVFKPTLKTGYKPIIKKDLGDKKIKMIYAEKVKGQTVNVEVPEDERRRFCLSDDEVLALAKYAMAIEDHYSQKAAKEMPMDIEWAKDGILNELFIVQARPETVESQKPRDILETYHLEKKGPVLVTGMSVGEKIGAGRARVIKDVSQLSSLQKGEVLVSHTTTPDWEPAMKIASAIVTNTGGRTSHAAIVSREFGIPAVVGTDDATEKVRTGQEVTVCCAECEKGFVYEGKLPYHVEKVSLKGLKRPKTQIRINLGNPDEAFAVSAIPNDGCGLARLEFIIGNYIKIHPMALIHPERVKDEAVMKKIDELTYGYDNKKDYFVDKLSQGIGTIAAAFYPKPVIVRFSDFKSNEYASLIGGEYFEVRENNPMLGFRGAARYYNDRYKEGFALECAALKRAREVMGLTNIIAKIPFCRRIDEMKKVQEEMAKNGLKRGENGLEVFMMCEIPSNVILVDGFCEYVDGISIGSNDLTQLVLGVDRDSEILASEFDERDPAVMDAVSRAIRGARRNKKHSALDGEAPSDYPEYAEFLVREGISSISLIPDAVMGITRRVLDVEKKLETKVIP
ncbi:phosphoenolpyruvate synthase [Methanocella paludicola SANAE]|uniref:Phosphoenolpyruvate synthase n=1 Tax=Methanocella paludicola (strain DSM 17711 / JCM 13418 / NBRC 101707 / SANAE) TaxID=304371 RepID=D1YY16_METPS|nr:phosphoenolpyruvate synthase [Methanocella paludicola]BAI61338.1 phosphoenolpyruvate synthase [Methanocella paludicola SANAE]